MANIESFISGSEKLTSIFGYWPSFHDAEVLEMHVWRGKVNPAENLYQFPVLTLKFHVWELTKEANAEGYMILRNHTLVTLEFHDTSKLQLKEFNHLNAILELNINRLERTEPPSPYFFVRLVPSFGIDASFECLGVEVVEAISFKEWGDPT